MDHAPPRIEIVGPDRAQEQVTLDERGIRIGRSADAADVVLSPDPQRLVSKLHCLIEPRDGQWHVIDNGSRNGTFIRQQGAIRRVSGATPLADGDTVLLLAALPDRHAPKFWELTFRDAAPAGAGATNEAGWDPDRWLSLPYPSPPPVCLDYDWVQARLYRVSDGERTEIEGLRLQEQQLIRYMAERNRANGNVPVLCTYEELIHAVWGDDSYHGQADITHLLWELRKKIDAGRKVLLLETVRKAGCRLHTCPVP